MTGTPHLEGVPIEDGCHHRLLITGFLCSNLQRGIGQVRFTCARGEQKLVSTILLSHFDIIYNRIFVLVNCTS